MKLHDLEDNMDVSRLERVTEKDLGRLNKYIKAYRHKDNFSLYYKTFPFPYNRFIHIPNSLSVTEYTLPVSVIKSFSKSFFMADWTELAEVKLCFLTN